MATVNQEVFQKLKKASKLSRRQDGDGNEIQVEVREDEEQSVKLQEIIDLLVAAGYFRARIKGLSPFDKVVGGMTWCIESLDVDIDIDLLFQENSTIGQKIALTEKIVAVLPKIKCPHRIEPHQIQGLDFIHIFPVIQWLVKASMEARQEKSAFVRSFAINQFEKEFPEVNKTDAKQNQALENLKFVKETYRPHRYYKRKNAPPPDILSRVQITLLEYGFRGSQKSRTSASTSKSEEESIDDRSSVEEEQKNIEELLSNLTAAREEILQDQNLTEEDRQKLAKHYESLHLELKDGGFKSKEAQQLLVLEEQTALLENNLVKLESRKKELEQELDEAYKALEETRLSRSEAERELKEFEEEEKRNPSLVKEVEDMVILNDNLKVQEAQYKESCKKELARLQKEIGEFRQLLSPVELTAEEQSEMDKLSEKVRRLRLGLAKKNQIVSKLHRQLDDVPNRAEMAQYQRRFLELYNQVAAKHKETKQYYTLYNTLEDKRMYMQKELSLLNSIADNYPTAMQSSSDKEEFLKQLQNIVEGVHQNRLKLENKVSEEKSKRDELGNVLQGLLELQRAYANAVKQLSLECRNYELLLSKKGSETQDKEDS